MWCSRGCLGPHATSVACLWHVSVVGGARRRGCGAGGVSVIFNRLLVRGAGDQDAGRGGVALLATGALNGDRLAGLEVGAGGARGLGDFGVRAERDGDVALLAAEDELVAGDRLDGARGAEAEAAAAGEATAARSAALGVLAAVADRAHREAGAALGRSAARARRGVGIRRRGGAGVP